MIQISQCISCGIMLKCATVYCRGCFFNNEFRPCPATLQNGENCRYKSIHSHCIFHYKKRCMKCNRFVPLIDINQKSQVCLQCD